MNQFQFSLNDRILHRGLSCVVIGRAQYIVRSDNMYMLQYVEKDIEFEVNVGKAFWEIESKIENYEED